MMNIDNRYHDVFFYGLYMDPVLLQEKGVEPRQPRLAKVEHYVLSIGDRATLQREQDKSVYGMVYSLTHAEMHSLYTGAGLYDYAPEVLLANVDGESIPVLCWNLVLAPNESETNHEYAARLLEVKRQLGVPA